MDLLSEMLLTLKVESTAVSTWHVGAPWGLDICNFEPAYYINVVEGHCWVWWHGQPPLRLAQGDTLLAPKGGRCVLASAPGAQVNPIGDAWIGNRLATFEPGARIPYPMRLEWGGHGPTTRLLVFALSLHTSLKSPVLSAFPSFIIQRHDRDALSSKLQTLLDFLAVAESEGKRGYFGIATHFAELMFICALRAYALSNPESAGSWLRGWSDPKIAKALGAIHSHPDAPWTLVRLAASADMSRSAFARRFTEIMGVPPRKYLDDWRIHLAAERLVQGSDPLTVIAGDIGYQSDRVFRQAFKQRMGVTPADYRRHYKARHRSERH